MGMRDDALYAPGGTGQVVAIGAASVATANVLANGMTSGAANVVGALISSSVDCWFEVGSGPVAAVNTSTFLPANVILPIACGPNDKVAFIQSAASGTGRVRPLVAV